jgi:hypothetical protein
MSLPPTPNRTNETAERLEQEAMDNGHDIGKGFIEADVLGTPFLRMECRACHEVAYLWPDGSGVLPMNPGRCRGRVKRPDLGKEGQ